MDMLANLVDVVVAVSIGAFCRAAMDRLLAGRLMPENRSVTWGRALAIGALTAAVAVIAHVVAGPSVGSILAGVFHIGALAFFFRLTLGSSLLLTIFGELVAGALVLAAVIAVGVATAYGALGLVALGAVVSAVAAGVTVYRLRVRSMRRAFGSS